MGSVAYAIEHIFITSGFFFEAKICTVTTNKIEFLFLM
jgi:hypothetical protein